MNFVLFAHRHLGLLIVLGLVVCALSHPAAAARKQTPHPDFTKGDPIPENAAHNWTLGATGARGWIYSNKLSTGEARQIRIMEVAADSPASGILEVGDVILGLGKEPFSSDARIAFAKALTAAESTAGGGKLQLLRWRDGKQEEVTLELPVLGDYSPTAPYDCRMEGARILSDWKVEEGIDAILFYAANQNHWGSAKRVPKLLDYLRGYGAHAKPTIPELEKLEADFADGEEGFPVDRSKLKAEAVRNAITFLKETEERPDLIQIQ
jgi:hypothetical protein